MNTILWNTSKKQITVMYDGKNNYFAPDEKKSLPYNMDYEKAYLNHLLFEGERFGLVELSEKAGVEDIKKAYIKGVKARWRQMDFICRNYRTMNKEREAAKMSAELPSDYVAECAQEAKGLLSELKTLEAEKFKAVEDYLGDGETKKTQDLLDESERKVEVSTLEADIVPGRKRGR
jgi:hypothetical protein